MYLVFVSYDRCAFLYIYIYGYMRMGGQRTWCCKENMVLLCFLQDMSRLFVHKFKFWIVFNINDIYIVLTILELNLRLLVPNGPAGQHCPCQANRFKRKMQGCIATFDLYLLRSFKCPSRNLSNFVRVDCTSPVHMLIRFVVLATEPNRLPRHAHHRTFTVDIALCAVLICTSSWIQRIQLNCSNTDGEPFPIPLFQRRLRRRPLAPE